MSKGKNIAGLVFLAIVAFVLINAIYTVNEVQQIIVTQFGKPIGEPVTTAGLKVKVPFIQVSTRSTNGSWNGMVPLRICQPRTSCIFLLIFSRVGGSSIHYSTFYVCVMSVVHNPDLMTSLVVKREMPWPNTN